MRLLYLFAGTASVATFIVSFFMTFVSWNNGPSCWKKLAPMLYFGSSVLVYVFLPLAYVPWSLLSLVPTSESYMDIKYIWCLNYAGILLA